MVVRILPCRSVAVVRSALFPSAPSSVSGEGTRYRTPTRDARPTSAGNRRAAVRPAYEPRSAPRPPGPARNSPDMNRPPVAPGCAAPPARTDRCSHRPRCGTPPDRCRPPADVQSDRRQVASADHGRTPAIGRTTSYEATVLGPVGLTEPGAAGLTGVPLLGRWAPVNPYASRPGPRRAYRSAWPHRPRPPRTSPDGPWDLLLRVVDRGAVVVPVPAVRKNRDAKSTCTSQNPVEGLFG
jgi:hypothetical protein